MELNQEDAQGTSKSEAPMLPKECSFTMQQWLYRRTIHTKRYKKRYVVLHNERLYTFTKIPSFDKFDYQNINNVLKSASNSWILTGSIVSADPDVNSGLFKWKIQFKNYKKPVSASVNLEKFIFDKPELDLKSSDHIDSIFEDVTSTVLENKNTTPESHDCLWFATTNHKVASDWLIALLHTSRYGSLYNLIYKNPSRRRYQQFTLPWYLMALDYLPNLSHDENPKQPLTSFTYIKINILRLFEFPVLPNAKIYCAVEFNSSFYILPLYRYESDSLMTTPTAILLDDDRLSPINTVTNRMSLNGINNTHSEIASQSSLNPLDINEDHGEDVSTYSTMGANSSLPEDFPVTLNLKTFGTSSYSAAESVHLGEEERHNVLTRLKNLNSGKIEKKQIAEKRSIAYNDASVCIPVYKNTTQEVVWLHFFGDFDVYMGTASIRDLDFGSRDPAPVKTCMIKLIDPLNPLNYKRVDVSTYKGESTVLNKSTANTISNDRGFVELSVIIPKHLGNFLDPVTISYGSPKEYLSNATKSSITAGIQMLIANIKRVRQSFTVLKDIIHALKSVLEFKSFTSSFLAMSYFILVFGIFPNRMIIIFLLPLLGYIVCTHPSFVDMTFLFLLKFPILTAILPKRLLYPFLLIPKTSCILCSKKPSFLQKNAQTVNPEMVTKVEISSRTFHYSSKKKILPIKSSLPFLDNTGSIQEDLEIITNPFSAAKAIQVNPEATNELENNTEKEEKLNKTTQYVDFQKRISVHLNSLPMITSKHLLNDSIEVTRYKGTRIETCKHRGIILSYLSIMFINEMGEELFDSVKGDGLSIIKGYHDIYYNTPPYRHVPFWANVKFTFYFFMYMLFITFFGGITNLNLLHLLHRNKLMCRLTLESTGVSENKPKGQQSESKPKTTSLYENERRIMFGKFSKVNLRFYERTYFSTEDGKFVSVDLSKHIVRLVVNDHTDSEGWTYARNWNSQFTKTPTSMTFVRRRKWLLTPKEKNTEYILKRRFTSNITSDYFAEINEAENTQNKGILKEHDLVSISSTDSYKSPRMSNHNIKVQLNGVDLIEEEEGNEENEKKLNTTNINDLKKTDSVSEMKIDPDENVKRLYSRRRKIKGIVDKFKDMRERRRNQKEDSSNMQMYINTLVKTKNHSSLGASQIKNNIIKGLGWTKQKDKASQTSSSKTKNNKQGTLSSFEESENSSYATSKYSNKLDYVNSTPSVGTLDEEKQDIIMALMNVNKSPDLGTGQKSEDEVTKLMTIQSLENQSMSSLRLNSNTSLSNPGLSHDGFTYKQGRIKRLYRLKKHYKREEKDKTMTLKKSTNKKMSKFKITRLLKYVMTLYRPEEEPPTDRTEYSTISQLSTASKGAKEKGILWKMMETVCALMLVLPVCVIMDLFKLLISFFWLFIRTLLGIPETESEPETSVTKTKINKYKTLFKLVTTEDNEVYFKIRRRTRCFLIGERMKIFKRICRAEKISFVHNMNKLMFSSSKNYQDNSETNSEPGSVSSVFSLRQDNMDRLSDDYMEDSDAILDSDIDTKEKEDFVTEDELEELKAMSMNPFDLDDSDEDIINMIRKSYSNEPEQLEKKIKKKKGKLANYISTMYLKRMAKKGKYIDEQHLSDYEQDSDENIKNDNKIGLIATLKKVKDQIVMANYKINLYNMRFEKLLNMFSWKNYSVTTIVLFLLILVIVLNLLFSIEIIMLAYILLQFKSGYRRGTWERIIINTTKRHINKAIVELEIFRPFWDLSTHQIKVLANRIKSFSSIELEVNTIREAKDEVHLAYIVSERLIATKFSRNWKRYRWINNLFRQAPCKQY